jgi:hypothetical protein
MTTEEDLRHGRWVHENVLGDWHYADSEGRPVLMTNVDMHCARQWRRHLKDQEREQHGSESGSEDGSENRD